MKKRKIQGLNMPKLTKSAPKKAKKHRHEIGDETT